MQLLITRERPMNLGEAIAATPPGGTLRIPAGTHEHSGKIVRTSSISIIGEGKGISRLVFSGLGSGIEFNLSAGGTNHQPVNLQDFTMFATAANAGTALRLVYPPTEGVAGGLSSFPSCHIEDVAFLPDPDISQSYWTGGMQLVNARHAKIVRPYYKGRGGTPPPTGTFGIRLTNAATDPFILNPQVYNAHRAIYCDATSEAVAAGHQAEGVHIVHPNLVEVIRGIELSTLRKEAGLHVTKGHISAHEFGVLLERRFHATIEGTLIFKDSGSVMDFVGIRMRLAESHNNNVYGVHIRTQPSASGAARGMVISDTERANIFGNNIWFPEGDTTGVGITLTSTCTGSLVHGNLRTRGARTVLNQGVGNRVTNNLPA